MNQLVNDKKICCCKYMCHVLRDILLSCAVWKGKKLTLPA